MAHPPFPETSSSHSCSPSHTKRCKREMKQTDYKRKNKQKQTNHIVTSFTDLLRWGECGNMTLSALMPLNHSPTSSRTKILGRSRLQLIATSPLIDSFIWPRSFGVLLCVSIALLQGLDKMMGAFNITWNMKYKHGPVRCQCIILTGSLPVLRNNSLSCDMISIMLQRSCMVLGTYRIEHKEEEAVAVVWDDSVKVLICFVFNDSGL